MLSRPPPPRQTSPAPAWQTLRISAAGHCLEVTRVDGHGPTLVFLHEGLGSVSAWRDFPRRVAAATGNAAVVYSRWGYGQSDPVMRPRPVAFMHHEARRTLPALLSALAIEDTILIGHSDGASIALIHAAEVQTRTRALILEAPHVMVEDLCVQAIARFRAEYVRTDFRTRLGRHHADPDGAFYGWADVWLDAEFRSWNIESLLSRVRAPTLVIQGEADEYGTLAQVDAVCQKLGGATQRLILPACGHAPHRDRPEEVLAAMTHFIEQHS